MFRLFGKSLLITKKIMNKKVIAGAILTIVAAGAAALPMAVSAENLPVSSPKEKAQARLETRCQNLENRINGRIDAYDANYNGQVQKYTNIKQNVTKAMTRLTELGYNTSKVNDDLKQLDALLKEWNTLRNQFIAALQNTQDFVCGESEGAFKNAVDNASADAKLMRAKAEEIKNFVKNTLRSDLQELRKQKNS